MRFETALVTAAPLCSGDGQKPRGARPKGSAAPIEGDVGKGLTRLTNAVKHE